jgi:hypothetical protein
MRAVAAIAFALVLLPYPSDAECPADVKFCVKTQGELGFSEGADFYKVGGKISDFLSTFGPAERKQRDALDRGYLANCTEYYYVNDGLVVTVNKEGRIIGFIFYTLASNDLRAASVSADKGIAAGASVREIIKLYGPPFKRKDFLLGYMEINYKFGELVLSFGFREGLLKSISIHSGYLPYLRD